MSNYQKMADRINADFRRTEAEKRAYERGERRPSSQAAIDRLMGYSPNAKKPKLAGLNRLFRTRPSPSERLHAKLQHALLDPRYRK